MKKFSEGVRRRAEIIGVCTTLLTSSVISVYAVGGNDDKAKKEVKIANTFIGTGDNMKELNEEFKRIAESIEQNMTTTKISTTTTTLITSTTPTTVLTTTTAPVTTTEETSTAISVTETMTEAIEDIVVTIEEYEADAVECEKSDNSGVQSTEESEKKSEEVTENGHDVIEESSEDITTVEINNVEEVVTNEAEQQPSGDITDYISESDYILLCNAVGHEYGSDWVSVQEKALVVEVIMNRVYSASYPGTIYDVLTQPYQFSGAWGYVNLGCFSYQVTESVKESVLYYFQHPDEFTHGYCSFNGDGYRNYFR